MAPTLVCVRHAQGFHNLGAEFHSLPDPKLTELGKEQCIALRDSGIIDQKKVSLVTSSPLTRTIHTAFVALQPAIEGGRCRPTIVALPDAQETSDFPCDTGSDVNVLQRICDEEKWPVDLSRLDSNWNKKSIDGRYSPAGAAVKIRAQAARQQIRQLLKELVAEGDEDAQVVLVTHGGYLHYFTEDWEESNKYYGTGWLNTEARCYTYVAGVDSTDQEAWIRETSESRVRRGKENHPMLSQAKQEELCLDSHQSWEDQGLGNALKL